MSTTSVVQYSLLSQQFNVNKVESTQTAQTTVKYILSLNFEIPNKTAYNVRLAL